jgi:membrane-associated phospholipid phosphatase
MNKKEDMIMYQWMKKYLDPICPLFAILPLLSCFGLNMLIYSGTMVMCADWYHYDLTTSLDQAVPLVPGWMYIYFGCFLFWTVNYIMVARINRNDPDMFYRFVAADMISRLVCGIIFMVFPTTNVRPEVTGTGFSVFLLQFLYGLDQPTNLFPSIHCLVSWFCYTGIRGRKEVPAWYRAFSCIFALLVVLSTQFTKQHYIADAIAGVLLAEVLSLLTRRVSWYRAPKLIFTWVNRRLLYVLIRTKGVAREQKN